MRFIAIVLAFIGVVQPLSAQPRSQAANPPASASLTIDQYLQQVQSQNLQARSLVEAVSAFELREEEPEAPLMPEFYAQAGIFHDERLTSNPQFAGIETSGHQIRSGIRKRTSYGLGADLYFVANRTIVDKASPMFLPVPDYVESRAVLELNQSLWRNGFGESTRADMDSRRYAIEQGMAQSKFQLKELMLGAQNVYWSLVSFVEIVKLQEENVDRAKKLRDRMNRGTKLRLFDDTDAMQAEAAFQTRELELQTSKDELAQLTRQFNTLRGVSSDVMPQLDPLPLQVQSDSIAKGAAAQELFEPKGRMSREDFSMMRAQAQSALAAAKSARSNLRPQLDLQASIAGTGRDGRASRSYDQSFSDRYPMYSVGVVFSTYLDFGLVGDLKKSYRQSQRSAEAMVEFVDYNEERAWNDLLKQQREAYNRFKRAYGVEKIQTELVKRERQRLLNGRATTFEALNIEQGLALAQIQRVRAQLAFLQVRNAIQTFEVPK